MKPHVCILSGYGINCETESKFAFERFGATAEVVHINDLIDNTKNLDDFQILFFPGGFSYGDHTGAGKAFANRVLNNLGDKIINFVKRDTLTLGICNGFQILVALGLVPALGEQYGERQAALMKNKSTKYQCEWVKIKNTSQKCVFTKGIDEMDIPIAHGEGNFFIDEAGLEKLKQNDQIAFIYVDCNPNGAIADIAGVCDPTGRIMGMMPHPERNLFFTNNPEWTKQAEELRRAGKDIPKNGVGEKIFQNAVEYFA